MKKFLLYILLFIKLHICNAQNPCNSSDTFWGLDINTYSVIEYSLLGGNITLTGNIIKDCPGGSLAISNNLNGGLISPTFYSSIGQVSFYWDGDSTWNVADTSNFSLLNAGGCENNLYFLKNGSIPEYVVKYDGNSYSLIYTQSGYIKVADIAVDSIGNFIVIGKNAGPLTDSIYVMSPSGQILQQFPFVINCVNAYGSMLLNSVLYIGLGYGNSIHPNTLLPVTFTSSQAIIGTPIAMPINTGTLADLASCSPGNVLDIQSLSSTKEFTFFPNPFINNIDIAINTNELHDFFLYDIIGRITFQQSFKNSISLNTEKLSKGVYFYELMNKNGVIKKGKIIKE